MPWRPVSTGINSSWSLILHHFQHRQLHQWLSAGLSLPSAQENSFLNVLSGEKGMLITVNPPLHCDKLFFFLPLQMIPHLPTSHCTDWTLHEFAHLFVCWVTFSSFLQIPLGFACWPEEGSSPFSVLLSASRTVTVKHFTAEDVLLNPVAAPQSREADPPQSNHLLWKPFSPGISWFPPHWPSALLLASDRCTLSQTPPLPASGWQI